jgi:hypothetical protein
VEPGRADDQAASGLRRARAAAVGSPDPGPAPREHSTRGGARCHQGGAPGGFRRAAAQTTRAPYRRPRVQLPEVPEVAAAARHSTHHPRAARPTRAACRGPWQTAGLRPGRLPAAQRGGAVRKQAQAVARDSYTLREAGRKLPSGGGHRRADDLGSIMSHQARSCP